MKPPFSLSRYLVALWMISVLAVPLPLLANPKGGKVKGGSVTFKQNGNKLTIRQNSNRAIIEWNDFSIQKGETTRFIQPSKSSSALNRVNSGTRSLIDGNLKANGQVILINPAGVTVGPSGAVNVNSFIGSTLDVSDAEFAKGKALKFSGDSEQSVINLGKVRAAGGDAVLIGRKVDNRGSIQAREGTAALAAGSEVLIDPDGKDLITINPKAGKFGEATHTGQIEAVAVEIKAAGNPYATAINLDGIVTARGTSAKPGAKVKVDAGAGGTRLGSATHIKAASIEKPDVRIYGDKVELTDGVRIEAPGGFVETSGAEVAVADGVQVDTRADDGSVGTWLIDPTDFRIIAGSSAQTTSGIGATTLATSLATTNVQIETAAAGTEAGHIYVDAPVSWSAATTLTLTAHGDIYINAPITASNAGGKLALEFGQGALAAGNLANYYVNAPVNLQAGLNFSTKLGSDGTALVYRVITSLGEAGSMTGTDLQGIRGNLSGRFVLGADIDASATSGWNAGAGFQPIGGNFSGTFDGLGHSIGGLFINRPSSSAGLFGTTVGSVIRNVGLEGGTVTGGTRTGGLVGFSTGGSITRSYSTVNVTGDINVGGLVGYIQGGGSVTQSYATGNVSGTSDVGGLVGRMFNAGPVSQSYATGGVTGDYAGGLVGSSQSGSITQSYATGQVTGSNTGGLFAYSLSTAVTQSFWNTETTGQAGSAGGTGLTTAQMKTQSSFTGWDFAGTWRMIDGVTYPLLTALSKSISGTAYSDAGTTNVGSGVSIQMAANGISLGTTTTTAGGAFQLLLASGQTQGLLWIDNSVSVKGNTILTNFGIQSADLWGGYVRVAAGTSNSIVAANKGALSDTDILFTASGNDLTLASNSKFLALGAYTLDGNITAQGTGTLDFDAAVTLTANSGLTTSNQNIKFGSSVAGNFGLTLAAGTGSITTHAVNTTVDVGTFRLNSGNWSQNNASLPSFTVTDFQFAGGSFLRVKGGDGNTATPYQIADVYGLQGMGSQLSREFQLANDINASATVGWNGGAGFSPIGNGFSGSRFTGRFDGLGHTINGLVINRPGHSVGLFGGLQGTVQNVGLLGGSMSGGSFTGALVGENYGTITRSFSTVNVTSSASFVGGLVGVGNSGSVITQSYATGNVTGDISVGGLIGFNRSSAIIQQSYATGSVSGNTWVGGLAGQHSYAANTTESYATGGLPLVGIGGNVTNSYAVGHGITLAQLEAALPAGFDSAVWGNADNHSTPYIKDIVLSRVYIDSDPGTTNLYQIIQNVDELQSMADNLAGRYALGNAIDASATSGWNSGLGFSPVGNGSTSFTGVFDGLSHVINGLTINRPSQDYVGLFGAIESGAVVRNVGLSGGSVRGEDTVGGLVGASYGGTVSGSYATAPISSRSAAGGLMGINQGNVENSYATGSVSGQVFVGGLVGSQSSGGEIVNSYATGSVSGDDYVGGLLGGMSSGLVTASFWDTQTSGRASSAAGTGKTTAEMHQQATFTGWDISAEGGTANVWRIYEGNTAPLLRSFLTAVTATVNGGGSKVYDGTTSVAAPGYVLSNPSAAAGISGTAAYQLDSAQVGNRTVNLSGLYSSQQGYDIEAVSGSYTVTQRGLTITADSGQGKIYGNAELSSTYTQSGLITGDSLSGTLSRISGEDVGNYGINQGSLSAGNNYAISYTGDTFGITPRGLTVTADSGQGKIYGNTEPGLTYTQAGLVNGDSFSGTLSRDSGEDVGSYAINLGSLSAGSNYAISYTGDTFGIRQRGITITADSGQGKIYGNADPALTYSIGGLGLVNGDSMSGTLKRDAGEIVGDYAINQGSVDAGTNYLITYGGDTFGITPRGLTITVDAGQGKIYGNPDAALTYTVGGSGLVNGDSLSGTLSRVPGENVGNYAINQGSLSADANYSLVYIGDTFGITPRGLTITANSKSKTYGDSDPALTYKIGGLGLINGDTLTGSLDRETGENAGTYDILQDSLSAGRNYSITYRSGNFRIDPASLVIRVNDSSRREGGPNPSFSVSGNGFRLGDRLGDLTGVLDFSGPGAQADANTGPGLYLVSASGLSSTNYEITWEAGLLTIVDAPVPPPQPDAPFISMQLGINANKAAQPSADSTLVSSPEPGKVDEVSNLELYRMFNRPN